MRRWGNIAALGSAVVCVLSAMLVVRSVWVADEITVPVRSARSFKMASIDAKFVFATGPFSAFHYNDEYIKQTRREVWMVGERLNGLPSIGIGWGQIYGRFYLILPLWLVPILTAIPPMRWWRTRRRESRRGFAVEMPGKVDAATGC